MNDTVKQPKYYKELLQVPVWTAAISFVIGTFLFGLYKVDDHNEKILIIGFYYVVFTFLINLVVFLIMVILSFVFRNHQIEILKYASIQLINIPIVPLYTFLLYV